MKDPREMIQYLRDADRTPASKRRQLDLLNELNRWHAEKRSDDTQLDAAMQTMEVAFRMQTEAPEAFDLPVSPSPSGAATGTPISDADVCMRSAWSSAAFAWYNSISATASRGITTTTS